MTRHLDRKLLVQKSAPDSVNSSTYTKHNDSSPSPAAKALHLHLPNSLLS